MGFNSALFTEATNLKVSVEWINSDKAIEYLERNFEENRKKSKANIKKWISAMESDMWCIGTDAIAFDVMGRLVNGQNRLSAVAEIGTSTGFPFVVVRNLPVRSIQILDIGRKRDMFDRMIIDGKQVDRTLLAGTRWAMTHYDSHRPGTTLFAEPKHDNLVYRVYSALTPYFGSLQASNKLTGLFIGAGARIYIDLLVAQHRICGSTTNIEIRHELWRQKFGHFESPVDRARKFVSLVVDGIESTHDFNIEYDGIAIKLRELHLRSRTAGHAWGNPEAYRQILSAAAHFMHGRSPKKLYTSTSDPFMYSYSNLLNCTD